MVRTHQTQAQPRGERISALFTRFEKDTDVLDSNYQTMQQLRFRITRAKSAFERETSETELKSGIQMLDRGLREVRKSTEEVNVVEIAELLVLADASKEEALEEAKEYLANLKGALDLVEGQTREAKADMRYKD